MEFKHFKQLLQFSKESWLSNILAKSAKTINFRLYCVDSKLTTTLYLIYKIMYLILEIIFTLY
jgi:hypothetical protein